MLYKDLKKIADEHQWFWNISNENALGMRIQTDLGLLDGQVVIQRSITRTGRFYRAWLVPADGPCLDNLGHKVVTDMDVQYESSM